MRYDEFSGELNGFQLPAQAALGQAPAGRWPAERVRAELARFCSGRERWPSAAEFSAAGRASLYLAASRHGGVERWAPELGFPAPGARGETAAAPMPRDELPAQKRVLAGLAALTLLSFAFVVLTAGRPAAIASLDIPIAGERADAGGAGLAPAGAATAGRNGVALRLTSHRERTRVAARAGSASGRLLWRGTIAPGRSVTLRGPAIWLEVDEPASLAAFVDGKRADVPRRATELRVTSGGVRVLARAPLPPRPPTPPPVVVAAAPPAVTPPPAGPAPDPPPPGRSGPSPDAPPGGRR
ncbi:MAG TPA: hypothetical protein VD704_02510 [Gaiellaceae bacterium]|nr:hypothetical protein [Gaiellaceae bacterium]